MRKILLSSYAISPSKGSEFGVGWNFVVNLAQYNKVHLLYGVSGEYMGEVDEIENYLKNNPIENLSYYYVRPSFLARFFNYFNKLGFKGFFYFAFFCWQWSAFLVAKKIVKNQNIDLIHQLNPIGFREPGFLWLINKQFIWGPIGGAVFINSNLLKKHPVSQKILFLIKNLITFIQLKWGIRVRLAAKKASALIFSTDEVAKNFRSILGVKGYVLSQQGVDLELIKDFGKLKRNKKLQLVWAGRLEHIKNTKLIFEVLHYLQKLEFWELHIIGAGSQEQRLKEHTIKLGLGENIIWHGYKPRMDVVRFMSACDIQLLSNFSEANPTVLFDAMSAGLPTIALNQNGIGRVIEPFFGLTVAVGTYEETVKAYAKTIDIFLNQPSKLIEYKKLVMANAAKYSWQNISCDLIAIYNNNAVLNSTSEKV